MKDIFDSNSKHVFSCLVSFIDGHCAWWLYVPQQWAFSASWSSDLRALAMVQVFGVQEGMRLGPQIQDQQCQIVQPFCIMC